MCSFRSLKGLVVLITGAASGLGRGAAEHLVNCGCKVVIADLPSSSGARVAEQLGHDRAFYTPLDVSEPDEVRGALSGAEGQFGRVWALVNCAGLARSRNIYNVTERKANGREDWDTLMKVNVTGSYNVTRLGVEYLSENEPDCYGYRGVIVNTAGYCAYDAAQGQTAYAAADGAVVGATERASQPTIRLVTICPGLFDTPLLSYLPDKIRTHLALQALSPSRLGRREEFGHLVGHVLRNDYLNGVSIRLDAGTRLWS